MILDSPLMASRRRLNLDSLEDIFLKCPIKTLIGLRDQCHDLIREERFIYSYLKKNSEEQFIRVDDEVSVYDPNSSTVSSHALPKEFRTKCRTNGVCQILHCNGLILCQIDGNASNRIDRKLSIWNPALKEFRWIEPSSTYNNCNVFGFGFTICPVKEGKDDGDFDDVECLMNYKVLKFTDYQSPEYDYESVEPKFEMYDCSARSWRAIEGEIQWTLQMPYQSVSVNGNTYWSARCWSSPRETENSVLGFNFSTEKFKKICALPRSDYLDEYHRLSSHNGDSLAVMYQDDEQPAEIEIWVTNKLSDCTVSWTKYLRFDQLGVPDLHRFHLPHPLYLVHNDELTVWCVDYLTEGERRDHRKFLTKTILYRISHEGIEKQITGFSKGLDHQSICGSGYVPSLVPVP